MSNTFQNTYGYIDYDTLVSDIEAEIYDNIVENHSEFKTFVPDKHTWKEELNEVAETIDEAIEEFINDEISKEDLLAKSEDILFEYMKGRQSYINEGEASELEIVYCDDDSSVFDIVRRDERISDDGISLSNDISLYDIRTSFINGDESAVNSLFKFSGGKMTFEVHALDALLNNAKYVYKATGKSMDRINTGCNNRNSQRNRVIKGISKWTKSVTVSIPEEETESTFITVLSLLLQGKCFAILSNGEIDINTDSILESRTSEKGVKQLKKYKGATIIPQYEISCEGDIYRQLVFATIKVLNRKYKDEEIMLKRRYTTRESEEKIEKIDRKLENYGIIINGCDAIDSKCYSNLNLPDRKTVEKLLRERKKFCDNIEGNGSIALKTIYLPRDVEDVISAYGDTKDDEKYTSLESDKQEYKEFISKCFNLDYDYNDDYQYPFNSWKDSLKKIDVDSIPFFTSTKQKEYVKFLLYKYKVKGKVISDEEFLRLYFTNKNGLYKADYKRIGEYERFNVKDDSVDDTFRKIKIALKKYFDEYGTYECLNRIPFPYLTHYLWGLYKYLDNDGLVEMHEPKYAVGDKIDLSKLCLFRKYVCEHNKILIDVFNCYYKDVPERCDFSGRKIDKEKVKKRFFNAANNKTVLVTATEAYFMYTEIALCIYEYLEKSKCLPEEDHVHLLNNYKDYTIYQSGLFHEYLNKTSKKRRIGVGYDLTKKLQFISHVYLWEIKYNKDTNPEQIYFYKVRFNPQENHMSVDYSTLSFTVKNIEIFPLSEETEIRYDFADSEKAFYLIDNENKNVFHLFNGDRGSFNSNTRKISLCIKNMFGF